MTFKKTFCVSCVGEYRSREGCKVRGKFFVPTVCFTPFSFMCKSLVDEEIFLKGKVLTEERRRGSGRGRGVYF